MKIKTFMNIVASQLPEQKTRLSFELCLDERGEIVNNSGNKVRYTLTLNKVKTSEDTISEISENIGVTKEGGVFKYV